MFTYHYCAEYQNEYGSISRIDGVAILGEKVKTMEEYRKLKILIEPEHAHKLTISSLSLI